MALVQVMNDTSDSFAWSFEAATACLFNLILLCWHAFADMNACLTWQLNTRALKSSCHASWCWRASQHLPLKSSSKLAYTCNFLVSDTHQLLPFMRMLMKAHLFNSDLHVPCGVQPVPRPQTMPWP